MLYLIIVLLIINLVISFILINFVRTIGFEVYNLHKIINPTSVNIDIIKDKVKSIISLYDINRTQLVKLNIIKEDLLQITDHLDEYSDNINESLNEINKQHKINSQRLISNENILLIIKNKILADEMRKIARKRKKKSKIDESTSSN